MEHNRCENNDLRGENDNFRVMSRSLMTTGGHNEANNKCGNIILTNVANNINIKNGANDKNNFAEATENSLIVCQDVEFVRTRPQALRVKPSQITAYIYFIF